MTKDNKDTFKFQINGRITISVQASVPTVTQAAAPRIVRVPVDSTMMKSVGYDRTTRTLEIEFLSGRIYQYDQVGPSVMDELMETAEEGLSVGRYFNLRIRGAYTTREVT